MSAHTGKIGRLSKDRREELGRRIEDGHLGPELAEWLNSLPDVQAVLQEKFGGRAINEQNLSAWRLSGHVNWLRRQEARAGLAELIGDSNQMDDAVGDWSLGERLGTVLAAELNAVGMALLGGETDLAKRWERLREIHREVSRLRQDDDRARRAALQQERWDRELEKEGVTMEPVKRCKEESEVQSPESKVGEASVERAVNQDESRQNKVNQDESKTQSPKSEVGEETRDGGDERDGKDVGNGAGAKVRFLHEERLPCLDEPGCEILFTQDNTYGTRYRKVPIGWQDPEGISPGEGRNPRAEIRNPNQPAPEPAGGDACATILRPSGPYVPDPDPEVEAYNRWWRMNQNFEPFDYEELQRIYAELPQKIAEYQARLRREAGAGEWAVECMEGAGI